MWIIEKNIYILTKTMCKFFERYIHQRLQSVNITRKKMAPRMNTEMTRLSHPDHNLTVWSVSQAVIIAIWWLFIRQWETCAVISTVLHVKEITIVCLFPYLKSILLCEFGQNKKLTQPQGILFIIEIKDNFWKLYGL